MIAKAMAGAPPDRVLVWDLPVRLFHWSLVGLMAWSLASGFLLPATWLTSHIVAGTAAAALVVLRVIWGLLGPTYARFDSFLAGPRAVRDHIAHLGKAVRHIGHNPLGGLMVVALLGLVAALAATGTVVLGGSLKTGPLAFLTAFSVGEAFRQVHELLAWLLIGLVLLHIAGVVFESRRSHEDLVGAMIDGRKAARAGDSLARPREPRPRAAMAAGAAIVVVAALAITTLDQRPGLGVPVAGVDPQYRDECGACHMAFHPSLAPASAWSAIMAGLSDHFGEDASLDPEPASAIRAYLLTNSAEHFDTRPANRFRVRSAGDPLRITATPYWRLRHAAIPDAVFASPAVGARTACGACHKDAAAGVFYPSHVQIPEAAAP